jgi:hypothetical protein
MNEDEHRSAQPTVLVAMEQYLSVRENAEILADPNALRSLAEGRKSELTGGIYGADTARAAGRT